jgi:hypothetical protein
MCLVDGLVKLGNECNLSSLDLDEIFFVRIFSGITDYFQIFLRILLIVEANWQNDVLFEEDL